MEQRGMSPTVVGQKSQSEVVPLEKHYQLVIEDARALGQRRDTLTTMFLSIITLILGAQGYLLLQSDEKFPGATAIIIALALFGLLMCRQWLRSLGSYKRILRYRYDILQLWEQEFPNRQQFYSHEDNPGAILGPDAGGSTKPDARSKQPVRFVDIYTFIVAASAGALVTAVILRVYLIWPQVSSWLSQTIHLP